MKKNYILILGLLLFPLWIFAQSDKVDIDKRIQEIERQKIQIENSDRIYINDSPFDRTIPAKANSQFQALVFSYTQGVMQNYATESEFLKGQIVGRLFGANTTTTSKTQTSSYFEQRTLPFFIYSPRIFDGKVTLRASFHIDMTWGDVAYGTGGHLGGALSGDQVNLQTQNLEMEYKPAPGWAVNVGLQRLYDTPHDTYRTLLNKMMETGYRLHYWGSNGTGISVRRDTDWYKVKGGFYQLYENNVENMDDLLLYELSSQFNVSKNWNVGGSVYFLNDNTNGKGGVSILGQGPRSLLVDYNGAYKFRVGSDPIKMKVAWIGGFFSRNEEKMNDPFFLSGYINSNIGSITQDKGDGYKKVVDILGLAANVRLGYRYGQTTNDAITADIIYSSGNSNGVNDGIYTGVITGNTWGSPVGLVVSSGSYLVFPHANVINRYVAAIADLSNIGYGVTGATLNFGYDIIPNKFHAKVGTAAAMANVQPSGGGSFVGWEVNGKLVYDLGAFLSIEAHAAYMGLGDFYDSSLVNSGITDGRPANPWTALVGMRWLIF